MWPRVTRRSRTRARVRSRAAAPSLTGRTDKAELNMMIVTNMTLVNKPVREIHICQRVFTARLFVRDVVHGPKCAPYLAFTFTPTHLPILTQATKYEVGTKRTILFTSSCRIVYKTDSLEKRILTYCLNAAGKETNVKPNCKKRFHHVTCLKNVGLVLYCGAVKVW